MGRARVDTLALMTTITEILKQSELPLSSKQVAQRIENMGMGSVSQKTVLQRLNQLEIVGTVGLAIKKYDNDPEIRPRTFMFYDKKKEQELVGKNLLGELRWIPPLEGVAAAKALSDLRSPDREVDTSF